MPSEGKGTGPESDSGAAAPGRDEGADLVFAERDGLTRRRRRRRPLPRKRRNTRVRAKGGGRSRGRSRGRAESAPAPATTRAGSASGSRGTSRQKGLRAANASSTALSRVSTRSRSLYVNV